MVYIPTNALSAWVGSMRRAALQQFEVALPVISASKVVLSWRSIGTGRRWATATEFIERVRARTPSSHLTTMDDCSQAILFLLDNPGVDAVNLVVDGGFGIGLGG